MRQASQRFRLTALLVASMLALPAQAQQAPARLTAEQSDPAKFGWMEGSPPPPEKLIRHQDGSFVRFPQLRWGYSHMREFLPTVNVSRRLAPVAPLPVALRDDLDAVTFKPIGKDESMTWRDAWSANYTDAIIVLHKGRVVYERYGSVLKPYGQHLLMSVTKSFYGTMAAMLVEEGKLDLSKPVAFYVPELKDSGFADATVRNVMDMRVGVRYTEVPSDLTSDVYTRVRAGGVLPRPPGYQGPKTFQEFMQSLPKEREHGGDFAYKSVNTDVLGWVIRKVTGQTIADLLSERIWSRLGVEQDAYFIVDSVGMEYAGGGLNTVLRDLARFGEMMRNDGRANGQQIVPKAVVDDIRKGGDIEAFKAAAGYPTLPGWSYRNMWWISHNEHGAYIARGLNGQNIYVDPKAEMVIARFASHPVGSNVANDPTTLPAYHALAKHLLAQAR